MILALKERKWIKGLWTVEEEIIKRIMKSGIKAGLGKVCQF